jgi:hypothetical protein
MTVKADIASVGSAVTANAKSIASAKGADISVLLTLLQEHAVEMQILVKEILKLHPTASVVSATVNAGGSGGTNGAVTITGTTGTGTKFTATGTITAGALAGALTIANPGNYTIQPTSLAAEPVTGGSLTGATVALTLNNDAANLVSLNNILAELL